MSMPNPAMDHAPLASITGGHLRPGGAELTRRGLDLLDLPSTSTILDAGCGNGTTLAALGGVYRLALGVDLSPSNLASARKRAGGQALLRGTVAALPLQGGSVQGVVCECVLSLVEDPSAVLRECFRVLSPGGGLALADIVARRPRDGHPISAPGERCCLDGALDMEELQELLRSCGFRVEACEDWSRELARLAGQCIFTCGSLRAFWETLLPPGAAERACRKAASIKPGFCLITARKG